MSLILYQIIVFSFLPHARERLTFQDEIIYTVSEVSIKPQPPKGLADFQKNWSRKVVYPNDAVEMKIQGMVFIEFVVNKDGKITDAAIKTGLGHGCDEAALKGFIEASKERWNPGIKNEQPVKVKMVLPFYFRIIKF